MNAADNTKAHLNIHDHRRKDALIKALQKAYEKAETALLYLTVNNSDPDQIAASGLAKEHIEIALEHLGTSVVDTNKY